VSLAKVKPRRLRPTFDTEGSDGKKPKRGVPEIKSRPVNTREKPTLPISGLKMGKLSDLDRIESEKEGGGEERKESYIPVPLSKEEQNASNTALNQKDEKKGNKKGQGGRHTQAIPLVISFVKGEGMPARPKACQERLRKKKGKRQRGKNRDAKGFRKKNREAIHIGILSQDRLDARNNKVCTG